ncbi:hypothetical protein GP475_12175 [Corynebacterium poyangense]|uniref:Uncharacterized protein n=1 Tax=Corynebacterium poyangense TaxID=2684405 RepID=A0A7H0SRY0_9CORY|nr:hypothetical protein [Corynebacterium poyangense]MBZ8177249.1 hypothetical protein [Corynebacterium poyangense]QNQ91305.1 hypothetical protein GP475_12175 [Corynebacterium poyangense]
MDEANNTSNYNVRIIAALLLLVAFGGLPTMVDGRPLWAALLGAAGVIVAIIMLALSLGTILRNRRRNRVRKLHDDA